MSNTTEANCISCRLFGGILVDINQIEYKELADREYSKMATLPSKEELASRIHNMKERRSTCS
jgi:hypothetical protein